MKRICFAVAGLVLGWAVGEGAQVVGKRPYEMEWANRVQDHHPPLVDFEDLNGWHVETRDAAATFEPTREQQLWGESVGKLTYRGSEGNPEVRILPPEPIRIEGSFDAVTLWVYGNNWGWAPDPDTPQVTVSVLLADQQGRELTVYLYRVDFEEWYLMHHRLSPEQREQVRAGAWFKGILVTGGRNREDRALFMDNLVVYTEEFSALSFEPRPHRGVAMFPGQDSGLNQGPGQLPFPNRPETILPDNLAAGFTTKVEAEEGGFAFTYAGPDGRLVYRLRPETGTWSDVSAQWTEAGASPDGNVARGGLIRPCVDGGVYLAGATGPRGPETAEHLGTDLRGEMVESRWRLNAGGVTAEVTYLYRLWNKSLVMDVLCPGGQVAEVRYGRAVGLDSPRLVTNPFYPAEGGRPAVAVSGPAERPLFLAGNPDWYRTGASILWAHNAVDDRGAIYHGGTRYVPKTDGKRNDCYERFFLTLSPRYEEVLPNIPNPVSPWKQITGTRLWRAHGASDRERDARFWTDCHRWGMTQVVVTDHETGWRDGGESFTFRTRAAPGKGGDAGQFDYARLMQDKLGFIYGPYNNFTDFAPVNEFWSFDMISRAPDNQLQHAWMRCYAPKPARAVEYCARLAPIIEEKFHFSTAYCDVHTAVPPWHRVDYDPRVPGAGTMAAVFYAFGEIMLLQKEAWGGPVYSEGNYHCFYSGLTDGNYGQDQSYRPAQNPWLVDFDLRKMHDLGCNFGMGNPGMFYTGVQPSQATWEERDAYVDRFLAATVAFGHPGFLTYEGGLQNALRSYYMLQQLQSRYCLASVREIRYADEQGRLLDTSAAVAGGAYRRSQVIAQYADGTVTAVNGHPTERMRVEAYGRSVDLPPNGYAGWASEGDLEVWSSDPQGHRSDYAATPAYLYVDGRSRFMRFARAAGNGIGICRILPRNQYEILLHENAECGFNLRARSAVALDKEGNELGPAPWRLARGLTYLLPVPGAFSYRVTGSEPAAESAPDVLKCERDEVFAGEQVVVTGREEHVVQIPAAAKVGERVWIEREGGWIDFTVVPLTRADLSLEGDRLRVELTSHMPRPARFRVGLNNKFQELQLIPEEPAALHWELGKPQEEWVSPVIIQVQCGELSQRLESGMRAVREITSVGPWPQEWTAGMRLRGGREQTDFGETRCEVEPRRTSCGRDAKEALFMHPPWVGQTGYAFARFDRIALPAEPAAVFRAVVGKGDGSDLGDGLVYRVMVVERDGTETVAGEARVTRHEWVALTADLSRWAGREVALKLVTDAGPQDNSSGDWGCWAEMRLESREPVLHLVLDADGQASRLEPSRHFYVGFPAGELRRAQAGRLVYDGKGLSGHLAPYQTSAVLNGVELGHLAPASGDEAAGRFQEEVHIPLTLEAIATLGRRNRLEVRNPQGDSFSIRRFWIDLEFEDGSRRSSYISTTTYSQPATWRYAEGQGVPFGQAIEVEIWF